VRPQQLEGKEERERDDEERRASSGREKEGTLE
jgi:hypothetical protein